MLRSLHRTAVALSLVGFSSVGEGSLRSPDLRAVKGAFEVSREVFRRLFEINDVLRGGTYV